MMFCVLVISQTININSASAVSSYDDVVDTVNNISVECRDYNGNETGQSIDLTSTWYSLVMGDISEIDGLPVFTHGNAGVITTARSYLADRVSEGKGWGVSQGISNPDFHHNVYVYAGSSSTVELEFGVYPGDTQDKLALLMTQGYGLYVYCYAGSVRVTTAPGGPWYVANSQPIYGEVQKPYFMNFEIAYPAGYEGTSINSYPPAPSYVAMGDSFSSGEGNSPFVESTDQSNENECHRSSKAYPFLLAQDTSIDLGLLDFVACSGATTSNVLYGGLGTGDWNEGPQVDALSADTEVVTITIGGNDVGFKEYVVGCVVGLCGPGTNDYATIMSAISDTGFLADLEDTYTTILQEAENARVYVLDYPYMVDPTGADSPSCMFYADMSGAVSVQQALNAVISDAVDNVLATSEDYAGRLVYMPTNYIGSPFEGKHYCTDDPDGSSFDATTFHPNEKGHQDYYEIMSDYLS